jgi:hypothetical protein
MLQPRKPFDFDWSINLASLELSLGKVKHYQSMALHFALAWMAVGMGSAPRAFWLTMVVGIGWEIAESTAIGHHARLADLLPDTLAAVVCLGLALSARVIVQKAHTHDQAS